MWAAGLNWPGVSQSDETRHLRINIACRPILGGWRSGVPLNNHGQRMSFVSRGLLNSGRPRLPVGRFRLLVGLKYRSSEQRDESAHWLSRGLNPEEPPAAAQGARSVLEEPPAERGMTPLSGGCSEASVGSGTGPPCRYLRCPRSLSLFQTVGAEVGRHTAAPGRARASSRGPLPPVTTAPGHRSRLTS